MNRIGCMVNENPKLFNSDIITGQDICVMEIPEVNFTRTTDASMMHSNVCNIFCVRVCPMKVFLLTRVCELTQFGVMKDVEDTWKMTC